VADENLYSLLIRVEGGDVAAAEIIKAKYALKDVRDETKKLKDAASSPFEHAGVFLFSRQLFGLVGLSDLARHAMLGVTAAVEATAASFGIAMSTLGPVLLAIGAGVAIYEAHAKAAKKTHDEIAELAKKQQDALASTDELKDSFAALLRETDTLPPSLRAAAMAVGALDEEQRKLVMHTKGEQMAAAQEQIAANKARLQSIDEATAALRAQMTQMQPWEQGYKSAEQTLKHYATTADELRQKNRELGTSFEVLKADVPAIAAGFSSAKDQADKLTKAHHDAGEAARKHAAEEQKAASEINTAAREQAKEVDAAAAKQREAIDSLIEKAKVLADQAADSTRSEYEKKAAAIQRWKDEQEHAIQETYRKSKEEAEQYGIDTTQLEAQRTQALANLDRAVATKNRENLTEMGAAWKRYADQASADVGRAAAHILVEHATVGDEVKAISKMMAEQLIADMVRAGLQHTIFASKKMGEDTAVASHAIAASTAAATAELTRITTVAAAQKAADLAAVAAMEAKTAAATAMATALGTCTAAALALDAALAGAA
jgi:prefoldin subunit 5